MLARSVQSIALFVALFQIIACSSTQTTSGKSKYYTPERPAGVDFGASPSVEKTGWAQRQGSDHFYGNAQSSKTGLKKTGTKKYSESISQASPAVDEVLPSAMDGIAPVKEWASARTQAAEDDFANNIQLNRYPSPGFWGAEIVYQIQVDRFNNGDVTNDNENLPAHQNDWTRVHDLRHGGDLKGIMDRLDYLKDLGITALWITPIFYHDASYHGYCTRDFTKIDPGFGSNEEFRELVKRAHSRDIKVILDIVVNHMCDSNSWYTDSNYYHQNQAHYECANDLNNSDWGGYNASSEHQGGFHFGDTFFPPFKSKHFFNRCGSNSHSDMTSSEPVAIYGDFVSTMFDFNTLNRDFQEIFTELHKYWIAYADVDGFRMDAAKHINTDFIAYFNTHIRSYAKSLGKDNFYIIGEVAAGPDFIGRRLGKMSSNPSNPNEHGSVPQSLTNRLWDLKDIYLVHGTQSFPGLTAVYDFAHGGTARSSLLNEQNIKKINDHFYSDYFSTIVAQQDPRLSWNVLEIHDWPRFVDGTTHNSNPYKSALGLSYLATAQGIPVIYYGQEQGFNGNCLWHTIDGNISDAVQQGVCSGHSHDHALYRQNMFNGPWRLGSTVGSINNLAYIGAVTQSTHPENSPSSSPHWLNDPFLDRDNSVYQTSRRFNYLRHSCNPLRYGNTAFREGWNDNNGITAFSRLDNGKEMLVIVNNASWSIGLDKIQIDGSFPQNSAGSKYKNLLDDYQIAHVGKEGWNTYLYFNGMQIDGNSVKVFAHENEVGPWNETLKTHLCKDNPISPPPVGNQTPKANAGADQTVAIGESVTLDGSGSSDPDGSIVSYLWSNSDTEPTTTVSYDKVGTFTLTLTVTDNEGATNTDSVTINVRDASGEDWQRTVIFIYGETSIGQDMFIRGGIDHDYAANNLQKNCTTTNYECSIPIRHLNLFNNTTAPWKQGDYYLDWYGAEKDQNNAAEGTPLDWTTNKWPSSWGALKQFEKDGYGETPLNQWGHHYWILDVEMDCAKTVDGWFEIKSYISNGPEWESDVTQPGAPYDSINHFGICGMLNKFERGVNEAEISDIP